jgi:predicted RNA-binding Zn-ribbon protein involved in translation (DUF1610 family)
MPDQTCPLCETPAEYSGSDYGRRKAFNCPNCTEYIISVAAEARLNQAPEEWKKQLSAKARATNTDSILTITLPSVQQQHEQQQALSAVYEPRMN